MSLPPRTPQLFNCYRLVNVKAHACHAMQIVHRRMGFEARFEAHAFRRTKLFICCKRLPVVADVVAYTVLA